MENDIDTPGIEPFDLEAFAQALNDASSTSPTSDTFAQLSALDNLAVEPEDLAAPDLSEISPHLAWMPFSFNEGLKSLAVTRLVNKRLSEQYYKDRLVVLATQEKSASTLHEVALKLMLDHSLGETTFVATPRALHGGPLAMAGHAAFHFGLLNFYPAGGVCRGEFSATTQNIWMIRRILNCRTLVLTRHPADRLVALFCMREEGLRGRMIGAGVEDISTEAILNNLFIGATKTLPANISSLRDNLFWLESWVQEEAGQRSTLVRYEDMLLDPIAHFKHIHEGVFGEPMPEPVMEVVAEALGSSGEGGSLQPGEAGTRTYARGYSGKVGVWKDYFTPQNAAEYNRVVEAFLSYSPYADQVLEIYPDILVDEKDLNRSQTIVPTTATAMEGVCSKA